MQYTLTYFLDDFNFFLKKFETVLEKVSFPGLNGGMRLKIPALRGIINETPEFQRGEEAF